MIRLDGKVSIITGGARGLGAETARLFRQAGSEVIITDILDDEGLQLANSIGATYMHHDVATELGWEKVTQKVLENFGHIDVLMNNAGIIIRGEIKKHTFADWKRVIGINQDSVFLGIRSVANHMIERSSGSIINVSSVAVRNNTEGSIAYTASKSAVIAMTKVAAREFGPHGIRVNAILPGTMNTSMVKTLDPEGIARAKHSITVPLRRTSSPAEVAQTALFLASDETSGFCTGEAIQIDGGASL